MNLTPPNPLVDDVNGRWANARPIAATQLGVQMAFPRGVAITLPTDGKLTMKAIAEATINVPRNTLTGALVVAGDIIPVGNVRAGTVSLQGRTHSTFRAAAAPAGG